MSGGDDAKSGAAAAAASGDHQTQPAQYGTFQGGGVGFPDYSRPAIGFPQPAPPPGMAALPPTSAYPSGYAASAAAMPYYAHGYQAVPVQGYVAVAEGRPLRMSRLPCCGIGIGWFLFIVGFFLAAIPWYVGAFILLCVRVDYREKPGFVACTIAAVVAAIAILLGLTKGTDVW